MAACSSFPRLTGNEYRREAYCNKGGGGVE